MGDNVFVLLSGVDYWGKSVSSSLIYIDRKCISNGSMCLGRENK